MERKERLSSRIGTRQITIIGMLSAVSIVLGLTGLGFIPIPPVKATIMHLPVIIGAIIEGPLVGAAIGLIFGVFSIIQAITQPSPTSFIFFNPLIAVVPRILIGITSYYTYRAIRVKYGSVRVGIAAAVGTLTNTIGVLGLMYLLYLKQFADALGMSVTAARGTIIGIGLWNGSAEVAVSVAITVAVVAAIKKIKK